MFYQRQLTIQLRQRQLTDIYGNDVIYTGANPLSLAASLGTISNPWQDFTDYVTGLDKATFVFTAQTTSQNEQAAADDFLPKKAFSGTLTFETAAADFIRRLLVDDVAAGLNEIEVQVTDTANGVYSGFIIKAPALSWCEFNALCIFDLNLKQEDLVTQCIQRTLIADNWQGWFQNEPGETSTGSGVLKKHPRFSYCVEHRPNGMLVVQWMLMAIVSGLYIIIYTILWPVLLAIHLIAVAINFLVDAVNSLGIFTLTRVDDPGVPASPATVIATWAYVMFEGGGCGREHPAPLIRDYISNVCDKCGVLYNADTADIFFAPEIVINKSNGTIVTEPNPHYNACLYFPQVTRGVRRFRDLNLLSGYSNADTTTFYQPENQPVWALTDMLDHLKLLYNAKWQVRTVSGVQYLYFKRRDWFTNTAPIYDFSVGGADRSKLVEGICFQPQEYTLPASMNGLYQDDPTDHCGHEAARQMNGDPYSFNNTINNPLFHGILNKNSGFGATKFNNDGASTNYLYDALQVCVSIIFFDFAAGFALFDLGTDIRDYANYAVLMQTEQCSLPKVIIWSGEDGPHNPANPSGSPFLNSRAVTDKIRIGRSEVSAGTEYTIGKTSWIGTSGGVTIPDVNPLFPYVAPGYTSLVTLAQPSTVPAVAPFNDWEHVEPNKTDVIGRIGGTPPPSGVYQVQDPFSGVIVEAPSFLVNWPMYFQPYFKGTLWDNFHWIDDPFKNPRLHKDWRLKIPLCGADLDKLGVLGDGSNCKLLHSILVDTGFYNQGIITEITISYDTGADDSTPGTGQYIEIKGYV